MAFVHFLRQQDTPLLELTYVSFKPTEGPGLVKRFVCKCVDRRRLAASNFASNSAVASAHLRHTQRLFNLKSWKNIVTPIYPDTSMSDPFCNTCKMLTCRTSSAFPGLPILRLSTVNDLSLVEGNWKPQWEQYLKDRTGC